MNKSINTHKEYVERFLHLSLGDDGSKCWAGINVQDSGAGVFLVQMSDDGVQSDGYRIHGCDVWFDKQLKTLLHNRCQSDGEVVIQTEYSWFLCYWYYSGCFEASEDDGLTEGDVNDVSQDI